MRADPIPEDDPNWNLRNRHQNHWGFEKLMLDDAAKFMNFTYMIGSAPEAFLWGSITETGEWNGLVSEIVTDKVDFTVSVNLITYLREQVIDGTTTFAGDYLMLASPRPTFR